MYLTPNWPTFRVMDVTARMPTFPQSTLIHCLVRYFGHCITEHGRGTGGGYAIARTGISSSLVISCGASLCDDWKEAGRIFASIAFCKGGIGKPGSIDIAGTFFTSKCTSLFLSEIGVRSESRRVELKAAPSVLELASVNLCNMTVDNALVVFSLLTLGFYRGVYRSTIVDITPGINTRFVKRWWKM